MSVNSGLALELVKSIGDSPEALALLREKLGLEAQAGTQPPAYTVAKLAEEIGLSEKAIRAAIRRGELSASRVSGERGRYLIAGEDARAWARAGKRSPVRTKPAGGARRSSRAAGPMRSALKAIEADK